MHRFSFTFDEKLIHEGLRRDFTWRVYPVVGLLAAIPIVHRLWAGAFDPIVIGVAAVGIVVVVVRLRLAFRKGVQRVFELWSKQSPAHTIEYRVDDGGFEVVLPNGRSRYDWNGLRRLWRYDDV